MPKYSRDEYPVNSIVYERNCPYCKRDFWGNKPSATYCSAKCRVYANKKKREEAKPIELFGYERVPKESDSNYLVPRIIGIGDAMELLHYNPFFEELKKVYPDQNFTIRQAAKPFNGTLHQEIAYYTTYIRAFVYYQSCMNTLLSPRARRKNEPLTEQQQSFLASELERVEREIYRINKHLDQLENS